MRTALVVIVALLVASCGNGSSAEVAAGPGAEVATSTVAASDAPAPAPSTTTPSSTTIDIGAVVPPDDPDVLVGATIQLVPPSDDGSVPGSSMVNQVLIDGVATQLSQLSASCVEADCSHRVSILRNGDSSSSEDLGRYLVLDFIPADTSTADSTATIVDVVAVTPDATASNGVELLNGECMFEPAPSGVVPIAAVADWIAATRPPFPDVPPSRVWAVDADRMSLVELAIDPAWRCSFPAD